MENSIKMYVLFRVASMVKQFQAGMNSCAQFWNMVERDWGAFMPLFTHNSEPLSRCGFRELFTVNWSIEGSNKRDQEEDTMFQWECFLMSIQGEVMLTNF